jgi:hypothetical protein
MAFAILASLKKHWIEDSGILLANPGILSIDSRHHSVMENSKNPVLKAKERP